ncbi:hypothetical protein STCU_11618 [Strigomonas culicis]|uniref:Uncharacterized protein n=1 Tax=Strigomonas culicis TaxID=28005 RepID=S9TGE1_9TRYP|nr:hypothetical protein STCU_11618 [Strigomonas culicis]|eukprot:EPY15994.1 hypothetical protein STCU_11618 [Strigomonas culicis]
MMASNAADRFADMHRRMLADMQTSLFGMHTGLGDPLVSPSPFHNQRNRNDRNGFPVSPAEMMMRQMQDQFFGVF